MANDDLGQSTAQSRTGEVDPDVVTEGVIHSLPDHVLARVVFIANRYKLELGVTLYVAGSNVSGVLISGQTYFELLIADIRKKADARRPEDIDTVSAIFEGDIDYYKEGPVQKSDDAPPKMPKYVHLRDAQVLASAGNGAISIGLWRGRLSHVSGWSIGNVVIS